MIEKEIKITVTTDNGQVKINKLSESLKNAGDEAEKLGGKYNNSIKKSSKAVQVLDSKTNGLASSLLDVGDAAKKAGRKMSAALISSGIGAAVALVGLIVSHWDDIANALDTVNSRLNSKLETSEKILSIVKDEFDLMTIQEDILSLQGKSVENIRDLRIENLRIQSKEITNQLDILQNQLEIEQSRNREVTIAEKLEIGLFKILENTGLIKTNYESITSIAKAQSNESERSLEIQKKIADNKIAQANLEKAILKILENKTKEGQKYREELEKEEKALRKKLDQLQEEALNSELDSREKEIQAVKDKYDEVIKAAEKFNIDAALLEEQRLQLINDINTKYDDEELQKFQDKLNRKQEILDSYEITGIEKEIAAVEAQAEKDIAELEALGAKREEIERVIQESENKINGIVANANKEKEKDAEKTAEKKQDLDKLVGDTSIDLAKTTSDVLGSLATEGSALAKSIAVSQATISTYQGINKALAETTDVTPSQTLRFANAAAVGIAGFLNVAKILSTNENGSNSAPSGVANGGAPPPAPSFNLVEGTESNQIANSLQGSNEPVRAYVVAGDVTTAQQANRNIIEGSRI